MAGVGLSAAQKRALRDKTAERHRRHREQENAKARQRDARHPAGCQRAGDVEYSSSSLITAASACRGIMERLLGLFRARIDQIRSVTPGRRNRTDGCLWTMCRETVQRSSDNPGATTSTAPSPSPTERLRSGDSHDWLPSRTVRHLTSLVQAIVHSLETIGRSASSSLSRWRACLASARSTTTRAALGRDGSSAGAYSPTGDGCTAGYPPPKRTPTSLPNDAVVNQRRRVLKGVDHGFGALGREMLIPSAKLCQPLRRRCVPATGRGPCALFGRQPHGFQHGAEWERTNLRPRRHVPRIRCPGTTRPGRRGRGRTPA